MPTSSLRNGFAVVAGGACEASVSKDGHNAWTRGHPSRRAQERAPQDEVVRRLVGVLKLLMVRSPRKRASRTMRPAAILRDARKSALLRMRSEKFHNRLFVIPGRRAASNPESRDSPMCNCTSEVWTFGPSRNDGGRRVRGSPVQDHFVVPLLAITPLNCFQD